MNRTYEKPKALLKELFHLDQPDVDVGLYDIMHAKSDEVTPFLVEEEATVVGLREVAMQDLTPAAVKNRTSTATPSRSLAPGRRAPRCAPRGAGFGAEGGI